MEFLAQNPHFLDLLLGAIACGIWSRYPTDILAIAGGIVAVANFFVR